MSMNIFKRAFLIVSLFGLVLTSSAKAEQGTSFDPFGSETSPNSISSDKLVSGPLIPEVAFNNNDISMAFQIISDATGWSIFPTADVSKAKISLWARNVPADELFDTVVTMAGFIFHREGDIITVMTYQEYMQYYGLAKKVFTLKYASAVSVNATITPFLTKLGKSVIHKETNNIVLYESDANLEFIATVIERLDSPAEDLVVEVINLEYANCEDLAEILQSAFSNRKQDIRNRSSHKTDTPEKTEKNTSFDAETVVIPEEQTGIYSVSSSNQLVIVGTQSNIEKVKSVVEMVDIRGDNMVLEVVDLEYADSQVIAETLQQLFQEADKDRGEKIRTAKHLTGDTGPKSASVDVSIPDLLLSPQTKVYIESIGRTNQLIIKAFRADMEKLRDLIEKLDRYIEPVTRNYQLTYVDASEIFNGLEKILNLNIRGTRSRQTDEKSQGLTLIENTNSLLSKGNDTPQGAVDLLSVTFRNRVQHWSVRIQAPRFVGESPDILGKARTAKREARLEVVGREVQFSILAKYLHHRVRVNPQRFADHADFIGESHLQCVKHVVGVFDRLGDLDRSLDRDAGKSFV